MGVQFEKNTFVPGHGWFGPSYPGNEVTADVEAAVEAARLPRRRKLAADPQPPVVQSPAPVVEGQDGGGGATGTPPPKGGAGSTTAAWADYARASGVDVGDGATRDEIVAALDAAGVPTE